MNAVILDNIKLMIHNLLSQSCQTQGSNFLFDEEYGRSMDWIIKIYSRVENVSLIVDQMGNLLNVCKEVCGQPI